MHAVLTIKLFMHSAAHLKLLKPKGALFVTLQLLLLILSALHCGSQKRYFRLQ